MDPKPVLSAALGPESVLTYPNPYYTLILLKFVEIYGPGNFLDIFNTWRKLVMWPKRPAPCLS